MDDLLTQLSASAKALAESSLWSSADTSLVAAHGALQVVINQLTAIDAAVVHEIDGRGIVRASGSANASTWLREHSRMSITEARKLTALGKLLARRTALETAVHDSTAPATRAGVPSDGGVNCEQAIAIGRALDDVPSDAGVALVGKVEAALVELAGQFEPALLRKLGDRVLAHIAPEVAEKQLRRRLEREERQAARDRSLTLTPDGLGRTRLRGILDTESAAIVNAALDPLMRPIPARAIASSGAVGRGAALGSSGVSGLNGGARLGADAGLSADTGLSGWQGPGGAFDPRGAFGLNGGARLSADTGLSLSFNLWTVCELWLFLRV